MNLLLLTMLSFLSILPKPAIEAPIFAGEVDITIISFNEIKISPEKIVLTGNGYLTSDASISGPSAAITVTFWKSSWENSHRGSWYLERKRIEALKDSSGAFIAKNAGYGSKSHALYTVTCTDLIPKKPNKALQLTPSR